MEPAADVAASIKDGRWSSQQEAMRRTNASRFGGRAELQYIMGSAMLSCMESEASQHFAMECLKTAVELQPDYAEAKAALAAANGGAPAAAPSPPPPAPEPAAEKKPKKKASKKAEPKKSSSEAGPVTGAPPAGFEWGETF